MSFVLAGLVLFGAACDAAGGTYDIKETKIGKGKGVAGEGNGTVNFIAKYTGFDKALLIYNYGITAGVGVPGLIAAALGSGPWTAIATTVLVGSSLVHVRAANNWRYFINGGKPQAGTWWQKLLKLPGRF